jgi:hypothetical protein
LATAANRWFKSHPVPVPPEKQLLALGAGAAQLFVPQDTRAEKGRKDIMYLNRLTLIGLTGIDAETKTGHKQRSNVHGIVSRNKTFVEERRRRMGISHRMAPLRGLR